MQSFPTPDPITATLDITMGDVRIDAGDRGETVVDVRPTNPADAEDVKAAELVRISFEDGQLLVKASKLRSWLPRSTGGSLDVTIELPAGSDLRGAGQLTDFQTSGPLNEVRIKTGLGRIEVEQAAAVSLKSGTGDVLVEHIAGDAELTAGSGEIRARELAGAATVKNSNGDTWIGRAHGELRVKAANGDVSVGIAESDVAAKSANGDVRVADAVRGAAVLETHTGDIEIGIHEGTAAWLDINASAGRVHNALDAAPGPDASDETVEVRARTSVGTIVVRRAELAS
jgi:hypothetical protein